MRRYWVMLWLLCSCGSSGELQNALARPDFVVEDELIYAKTSSGLTRINLRGEGRAAIFAARYSVLDMSQDGAVFVLGDSDTNLYLGNPKTGEVRQIKALNQRTGQARLSPDGKTLAAVRHADFSLPQAEWSKTDDDTIYLIDVATGAVEVIPPSSADWPTALSWSADGEILWLQLFSNKAQRFELKSRTRTEAELPSDGLWPSPIQPPQSCDGMTLNTKGWRGDEGLVLERPGQEPTLLVKVTGRKRGFHDYQPTLTPHMFSKGCAAALFSFSQKLWIVDLESKKVAPLLEGGDPFPVP